MFIGSVGVGSGLGIGESYVVTTKTYTLDFLLSLPANGYYAADVQIQKNHCTNTYAMDEVLQKNSVIGVPFSAYFLRTLLSYGMTTRFITDYRNRVPTDSIINTLYWSWATVLDQSYRDIVNATHSMNVARADTTDLDIIGEVYHLRRLVNETDDFYRKRLTTQTSVLLGHGTKAACEAIIDQAIGVSGSSIVQGAPATVRVTFTTDASARAATIYYNTLLSIMPNMLAAGISWTIYLDLKDYLMDLVLLGLDDCSYTMDVLNEVDHLVSFSMDEITIFRPIKTYTHDILLERALLKIFLVDCFVQDTIDKTYIADSLFSKLKSKTYTQDILTEKRRVLKTCPMDAFLLKVCNKTCVFDELVQKPRTRKYNMSLVIV